MIHRAISCGVLVLVASAACGLRSDPFAPDAVLDGGDESTTQADDGGDPNRPGTCNDPLDMPFAPMTLRGELSGPSFAEGWCGSDGGPEDVYVLVPDYDIDVLLTLVAGETEFTPTLRVVEDGCVDGTGVTAVCTRSFADQPYHFLARGGHTYSIFIDSADGGEGRYAFEVALVGELAPDLCAPHPEVIQQLPGSAFIWNNDFTEGQGRVDGYCGGPGRENMFPLAAGYAGNMYAYVETSGEFAPVLSLRTNCAALSELTCSANGPGGVTELSYFLQPGQYYLVVDQGQIGAGGYQLRVDFE
jgi:hypothetical protein